MEKEELWLREEGCLTEYYHKGFKACKQNSWRAHQLSGLCWRRQGLVEGYRKNQMNNLYPQIFFVSYCCLHYDVLHYGPKCLRVSSVPQSRKDWDYGNDCLVNDVFENYKYLDLSPFKRALLENYFLKKDTRYIWATKNTNLAIENILTGRNVSFIGRLLIAGRILRKHCYSGQKFVCFSFLNRCVGYASDVVWDFKNAIRKR